MGLGGPLPPRGPRGRLPRRAVVHQPVGEQGRHRSRSREPRQHPHRLGVPTGRPRHRSATCLGGHGGDPPARHRERHRHRRRHTPDRLHDGGAGAPVRRGRRGGRRPGYLHWSALDNFEWGRWAPTFGLIAVDRETFERTPKPSLAWLGSVARKGGALEAGA
ncbi:family 1 glycosylhydrolase [Streptomyces sp. FXJ1.4098]|nr:family 1 glycosylhydrolase [Streptomyces sp. FXJ1.4098]